MAINGRAMTMTSVSIGESTIITVSDSTSKHDVAEHDRQERQQLLDQTEIARRARHQLSGAQAVVTGEVEPHQPIEDRRAQSVLHPEADSATEPTPHEREAEREQRQRQQQEQPRC